MSPTLYDYADQYGKHASGPELRQDPITGRWVIIASERARRPVSTSRYEPAPDSGGYCPFCEGSEEDTPAELHSFRAPNSDENSPGWQVRVVPNKFPALQLSGDVISSQSLGFYEQMMGQGSHEVIIECPFHETNLAHLPTEHVAQVFQVYRDRLETLKQDERFVYGMVFKNVGSAAGASLEHSHSQLIVLPIVPITVQEEMAGSWKYYEEHGQCIYCDMIAEERQVHQRVILETSQYVCFAPYASRFPFETWIVPRHHRSHFEEVTQSEIEELAKVVKTALLKLEGALHHPAYNYILHTTPFNSSKAPHYHWHIEIIPRLTRVAGFEWGTGFYINPVPPEEAATILRETEVDLTGQSRTA